MKIIGLTRPETKAAIEDYIASSKRLADANQKFFDDWARAKNQKQAAQVGNYHTHYFIEPIVARVSAKASFDKMITAIDNEISKYPFLSTEWRH